jgi:hypothetical protein
MVLFFVSLLALDSRWGPLARWVDVRGLIRDPPTPTPGSRQLIVTRVGDDSLSERSAVRGPGRMVVSCGEGCGGYQERGPAGLCVCGLWWVVAVGLCGFF